MANRYPITKTGARFRAPEFTTSGRSGLRGAGLLIRRREADHLDARAARDVHGAHDVAILTIRRGLDEEQLRRALIVQLVELGVHLLEGDRLLIDRVRAVRIQLQDDLIALLRLLLRLVLLLGWHLHVERPP